MGSILKTYRVLFFVLLTTSIAKGQIVLDTQIIKSVSLYNEGNINTPEIEYAPAFMDDKLVFLYSDVDHGKDKTSGEYFFDLGFGLSGIDNALVRRASFGPNLNTRYHEGPSFYDPLLDIMYVTRSGRNGKGKLKIYKHEHPLVDGRKEALNIASDEYSIGHPAVFEKGDRMILISDKESVNGDMDLYLSARSGDEWSEIAALNAVNSPHQELFPFVTRDSFLIFSSNRPGGYGGLDLYVSSRIKGNWSVPVLLPEPINSAYDDFSLIIREDGTSGYMTSNRLGGVGKDDIYRFESTVSVFSDMTIIEKEVLILDKLSLSPVSGVSVSVVPIRLNGISERSNFKIDINPDDQNGELVMKYIPSNADDQILFETNASGITKIFINPNTQYLLRISHDLFETTSVVLQNSDDDIVIVVDPKPLDYKPRIALLGSTVSVGSILIFDHIYYGGNEVDITEESTYELDALVTAMLDNEGMFVDLIVHTDSRGNKIHNLEVSKRRALATLKYLVDKGIDENRIIAIGRGEESIINHCKEGVPCSEGEHVVNRRTEIQIRRM